jgi:hypothetical protein
MALACRGRPVTFPTLGSFVLGSILNIALLSYGARRLLAGQRFSLSRTVVAGRRRGYWPRSPSRPASPPAARCRG